MNSLHSPSSSDHHQQQQQQRIAASLSDLFSFAKSTPFPDRLHPLIRLLTTVRLLTLPYSSPTYATGTSLVFLRPPPKKRARILSARFFTSASRKRAQISDTRFSTFPSKKRARIEHSFFQLLFGKTSSCLHCIFSNHHDYWTWTYQRGP